MRYLLSIILCLWASCALAYPPGFIGAVTRGSGGDPCAGFLVCESFEGTGAPTAPSTWTTSGGGTFNYDATTTPIDDSQYLSVDYNTSIGYILISIADTSPLYIAGKIRFRAFPSSTTDYIDIRNVTTDLASVQVSSTGTTRVYPVGGSASGSAAAFTLDQTVYFKIRYTKGTGSNAEVTTWTSTDGTTWTQKATQNNGASQLDANRIRIYTGATDGFDIDTLMVKNEDFNM